MKQLILIALLAVSGWGATGDIDSVVIMPDGYTVMIQVEGITGGVINTGFTQTITDTANAKIRLSVVTASTTTGGESTTITRTIYGTRRVRCRYPNETNDSVVVAGSNTQIFVNLSEYIYQRDASITASVGRGLYIAGGDTSRVSTDLTVVNNSTEQYQKPQANWHTCNNEIVSVDTMTLRVKAGSGSIHNGRDIACVKFIVIDQHSNADTVLVSNPTVVSDQGYAVPVKQYVATIPLTPFTQNDPLTCNFIAYPMVGDSVLYSGDGTYSQPTGFWAPIIAICDKDSTYGRGAARVSPTGNDGTGEVVSLYTYNHVSPPAAFLTQGAACNAIRVYHNALSAPNVTRNAMGGGVVYHDSGTYALTGTTVTLGTAANSYLKFCPSQGVPRSYVVIDTQTASKVPSACLWLDSLTLTFKNTGGNIFDGIKYLKISNCQISPVNNNMIYTANEGLYLINDTITKINRIPVGIAAKTHPIIVLGNRFNLGVTTAFQAFNFCGNRSYNPTAFSSLMEIYSVGATVPQIDNALICENIVATNDKWFNFFALANQLKGPKNGILIENNVVEKINSGNTNLGIASTASVTDSVFNITLRGNTMMGMYQDAFYCVDTTKVTLKKFCKIQNSLIERVAIIADWENYTGAPPHNLKFGNWSALNGVGYFGNTILSGGVGYNNEFPGLHSKFYVDSVLGAVDPNVTTNASYTGTRIGNGDYSVLEGSVAIGQSDGFGFDLTGYDRYTGGASGAYEFPLANTPPTITVQPQSVSIALGSDVVLSVTATGSTPMAYQWQYWSESAWQDSGEAKYINSFTVNDVNTISTYRVIVTNPFGEDTSDSAVITPVPPPVITVQPVDQYTVIGNTAEFTVEATGTGTLSYQWQNNSEGWVDIEHDTHSTKQVPDVTLGVDNVSFRCIVSDAYGADTSDSATLYVGTAPEITVQPVSDSVSVGADAVFTLTATGTAPITVNWQQLLEDWQSVGTGDPLTVATQDSGLFTYRSVVVSPWGADTSDTVYLTAYYCYIDSIRPVSGRVTDSIVVYGLFGDNWSDTDSLRFNLVNIPLASTTRDSLVINTLPAWVPRGYYSQYLIKNGIHHDTLTHGYRVKTPAITVREVQ